MEPVSLFDGAVRIMVAAIAGLAIGLERERLDKAAGLRTLALVSTGAAIFVLAALRTMPQETVRMAAGIATGVGFLGAGVILQERGQILGITTAAAVWTTAALGVCAGAGQLVLTAIGTLLTLFLLVALGMLDLSGIQKDARIYEVTYVPAEWDEEDVARSLRGAGLSVTLLSLNWSADETREPQSAWRAVGTLIHHARAIAALKAAGAVTSFKSTT